MKKILAFASLILAFLLLLPLTVLGQPSKPTIESVEVEKINPVKTFKILRTEKNEVEEISYNDYIFGVVAAEMPALYEPDALKAQAVAAHTFALHRSVSNKEKGYDITDNFEVDQAFITETAAKEKWGDKADEYIKKIKTAVKETQNLALTCNGEIILSAYHAISERKTEDCKNVWGGERSYLVSVDSVGDKLSPNFISTKTVTKDEIKTLFADLNLTDDHTVYFKEIKKTDAGRVLTLKMCENEVTGAVIREKLDLRSACFDVKFENDAFTFTVYGYGHGVGMSQYGANYMAQQGADFKEILCHYYTGCEITEIKS